MSDENNPEPEAAEPEAAMDTQLYLLLAELVTGTTCMFGVAVVAPSYGEGLPILLEFMNEENGKRFIPALHLQLLVKVHYVSCPGCETVVAVDQGSCPGCQMQFNTQEFADAVKANPKRVIPKVQYTLKALMDGSENTPMIRPEHLLCFDLIAPSSPSYKKWKMVAAESVRQMHALRSEIQLPTPEETMAVEATKAEKKGNILRP